MDRREAMLRELNLYPVWVRRNPVSTEGEASVAKSALNAVPIEQAVPVEPAARTASVEPVEQVASVEAVEPVEQVASVEPSFVSHSGTTSPLSQDAGNAIEVQAPVVDLFASDFQFAAPGEAADNSLREFQLKNSGGLLGTTDWPELQQKVQGCTECKLRAECTQPVFGTGDPHARWLFVGEAPGAEEDELCEPFVGASGRLLDNMLLAIGLQRSEVYLANVIKCRPLDDRHPHVGEIAACLPYLKRQIGLLQPAVIVALGKTAASALLDTDATIASLRGIVHDYKGIPLVVTYHPAYLLRSPLEKARAWQDLCLAVQTMDGCTG